MMIVVGWQLDVTLSPRERVAISQTFKLSTLRCIELQPDNPLPHHLLGRYYYFMAALNWLERAFVKTMLLQESHNKPFKLEGTHAMAEQKFLQAHSLNTSWLPTGLWMARSLLAQQRPLEEVSEWIEFGLSLECNDPSTKMERGELLELKAKLKP